mgnify:CR=1 FL=1
MAKVKPIEPETEETKFINAVKKYAFLKSQLEFIEKEQKELRSNLFEELDTSGEVDDKGVRNSNKSAISLATSDIKNIGLYLPNILQFHK